MARTPIRVLPASVAQRIAAGEVIERPASVVKELTENALDAGARNVRIDIRGGGLELVRVSDDGTGIPAGELWLACQRHATSKLVDDDLSQVQTLGFRGEALPSIAAMAELTLVSAVDDSGVGRRLVVRDGQVVADEPSPRPLGTTVTVRRLFESVPARLAAIHRGQAEVAQIGMTARRLALAAPTVRLSLFVEERLVFQTSGSSELGIALIEVYGTVLTGFLVPFGPIDVGCARLSGIVSGPEVTRPERGQVNLIVNGRWVQPRHLLALLEAAYRPLLPRGRHPILAAVIEVPPDAIDINIHPAKLDVRLVGERAIGEALAELIREPLGRRARSLQLAPTLGPAALQPVTLVAESREQQWDDQAPIVTPGLPPLRLVGQVRDRLLLLEGPLGLYLVDQHRAHERILYEQLAARHGESGAEASIVLPEPLAIELRPAQVARFSRRLGELAAIGFQCEVFGERTFLLRAAPRLPGVLPGTAGDRLIGLGEPDEVAVTLVALAVEHTVDSETWRERLLVRLACRTAVRRGRPLDRPLMRALVDGLGHTNAPAVCPHGSPLLMHVSGETLEKQFGWA
jgi:DNA mismatch repair protein MutL